MKYACLLSLGLAGALAAVDDGWKNTDEPQLSDAQIQDIISKFAAKEAAFVRAWEKSLTIAKQVLGG